MRIPPRRLIRLIVASLGALCLLGCHQIDPNFPLRAKDGQLDLRAWSSKDTGSISLQGEWTFYPQRIISPSQLDTLDSSNSHLIYVPGTWHNNPLSADIMQPHGYGTYVLRVLLPENYPPLAMKMTDAGTAYRLYVDGKLVHEAGTLGTSEAASAPGFKRALTVLPDNAASERTFLVQVSNFHYRSGGLWNHIVIGPVESLFNLYNASLGYSIFLASAIGVIALYHLGLYSQRRQDRSTLYFALFCLAVTMRVLATDERYLDQLMPWLGYDWLVRIEFISFLLGPPTFSAFLGWVMPNCYRPSVLRSLQIAGIGLATSVAVTPVAVFTEWLSIFQGYLFLSVCWGLSVLVRGIQKKMQVAKGFMFGFTLMSLMVFNDILVSVNILHTPVFLAGVGLFCFIIIQSYAISLRSAQAFESIQSLTSELESYSADLEQKVDARTLELEKANVELERLAVLDGLTQIANRRKFDDQFADAWSGHRRRESTLSIILCDIDNFKPYNDYYGHLQGDQALRQVARAIESALSRPGDLAARYGGEEFVVLLPDTPSAGAADVAEKIRRAVMALHIPHRGTEIGELTLSLGVATLVPTQGSAAADLLLKADQALYAAKDAGRNRVMVAE